ncbi:MAG TPA: citrate synthase, partial [Clostridiales bacterium]|nr:citrate synthase [Clostridiales bacterium]
MSKTNDFSAITPQIKQLTERCVNNTVIDSSFYSKYDVKRGLRDINGRGVLTGLTDISEIRSYREQDGVSVPIDGQLFYRGINIIDLVEGCNKEKRFGFEEVTYLLLFGELPNAKELKSFSELLSSYRSLPQSFVRDIIMKAPSKDMMNALSRGVLTLYAYDQNANDITPENVMRQCLLLIATFPLISVYGYNAYEHYYGGRSLFIHAPNENMSTAENILHLLRPNGEFTELEARVLDLALMLHAEHGGGNNSTFTTHVVTSSGTDTYSVIAAALGSLKGPRHGGANIKVVQMIE